MTRRDATRLGEILGAIGCFGIDWHEASLLGLVDRIGSSDWCRVLGLWIQAGMPDAEPFIYQEAARLTASAAPDHTTTTTSEEGSPWR